MSPLPDDHPQRLLLADEVHARPSLPLQAPRRASHLAVLVAPGQRAAEREHLEGLCRVLGLPLPPASADHVVLGSADVQVKWERHGEFSDYSVIAAAPPPPGAEDDGGLGAAASAGAFDAAALSRLPAEWLAAVPGATVVAAHALILPAPEPASAEQLAAWFGPDATVIGSRVADGEACAYTDFRLHADGCTRFVLLDHGMTPQRAGRVLQRLFEIEVYRMLALLALPVARQLAPQAARIEAELGDITAGIARDAGRDEALLRELTRLAAEIEQCLSSSQFRFGACRAYSELVRTRIGDLREERLPGLQTIRGFMARRFSPAVATCASVSQRLRELSERVVRASSLLATRVSIMRERQNQALLASMNRRARMQLRLQQTVEGLSVAAIAYYATGLVRYLFEGAKAAGAPLDTDLAVGLLVPLLVLAVYLAVHRARKWAHRDDAGH
ncbi:MAG TPA: DUF3422 domain-containing protein [Rubrivivax sp.]|nr:DUF3422 domain-containing protein [Burkholderiales bacterium]HNT38148.1 DUF3422 domain-containing protein [Rubrivivax sp.]